MGTNKGHQKISVKLVTSYGCELASLICSW